MRKDMASFICQGVLLPKPGMYRVLSALWAEACQANPKLTVRPILLSIMHVCPVVFQGSPVYKTPPA